MDALSLQARLQAIRNFCVLNLRSFEFWPSYYNRRYSEFLSYLELLPKHEFDSVLELGCGNGFYAALLSTICKKVTATDLEDPQIITHKGGLNNARTLLSQLGIQNVSVLAASAERLPFEDNSFDLVFSSHVFGYLASRESAVYEVNRVLRPGGLHVCVVPSQNTTLIRFFENHVYLLKRVFQRSKQWFRRPKDATSQESERRPQANSALKTFPFPVPQGAANTWWEEVRETSHSRWKKILTEDGKLTLLVDGATQATPLLQLVSMFNSELAATIYANMRSFELWLATRRWYLPLAMNSILVTKKT